MWKQPFSPPADKVKSEPMDIDSVPTLKRSREESSGDEDDLPLSKRNKKTTPTPTKKSKAKKEEEQQEIYRWWEEQKENEDDSIKWTTLEHQGVLFPPDYVPHGVKMKYDGKPITLSPEAEEVASFFAALLESDHGKNPVFQKNFFRDWQEVLKKDPKVSSIFRFLFHHVLIASLVYKQNPKITSFEKCDFRPIFDKFEADKEKKKLLTKEEKLVWVLFMQKTGSSI